VPRLDDGTDLGCERCSYAQILNLGTAVILGIVQEQTATRMDATKKGSVVVVWRKERFMINLPATRPKPNFQNLDKKQKKKKKTREVESESQGLVHRKRGRYLFQAQPYFGHPPHVCAGIQSGKENSISWTDNAKMRQISLFVRTA
jgi:hypothetical protein